MKIGLISWTVVGVVTLSAQALAQGVAAQKTPSTPAYVEQTVEGNQVITFPGDPLLGDALSAYGYTVRPPPDALRAGLIRPRFNFVPELLKTVENL